MEKIKFLGIPSRSHMRPRVCYSLVPRGSTPDEVKWFLVDRYERVRQIEFIEREGKA